MNIIRRYSICVILVIFTSFTQDNLPRPFAALLERSKMTYVKPKGFDPVKVVNNNLMGYEYAIKYQDRDFEERIALRPLDDLLKDYHAKAKSKKNDGLGTDPNTIYLPTFQAALMSISGGKMPAITIFRKDEAKIEFNADWGASAFLEVDKEFGHDYQYCFVVALHKDDAADAFCFYLCNTKYFSEMMQPAYYALRFK